MAVEAATARHLLSVAVKVISWPRPWACRRAEPEARGSERRSSVGSDDQHRQIAHALQAMPPARSEIASTRAVIQQDQSVVGGCTCAAMQQLRRDARGVPRWKLPSCVSAAHCQLPAQAEVQRSSKTGQASTRLLHPPPPRAAMPTTRARTKRCDWIRLTAPDHLRSSNSALAASASAARLAITGSPRAWAGPAIARRARPRRSTCSRRPLVGERGSVGPAQGGLGCPVKRSLPRTS